MKTQKAKGILEGLPFFFYNKSIPDCALLDEGGSYGYKLIDSEEAIDNYLKNKGCDYDSARFPRFARPCPLNPAHGFVDSRPIHSERELRDLYKDVKKADPDGEVILARAYHDVAKNFIFVDDGLLSVGNGNDGATNGSGSISFPVCPDKVSKEIKNTAGIKANDSVYMEGVYAKSHSDSSSYKWRLVQLRGGPEMVVGSPDFVPESVEVKKIVRPHDDLLAWAKEVEAFEPGTVVHGKGHTLASHAAVHCILHGVPFVTTYEPKVGTKLKVTEEGPAPKISRKDFRKGVQAAMKSDLYDMKPRQMLYFTFSVLHNWAYLRKSEHASWLLGAASASLSSICTALVLGEYRHARSVRKPSRNVIYKRALSSEGMKQIPKLTESVRSFCFGNNWASGYGGIKWGICNHYTIKLYREVSRMYNGKTLTVSDKDTTSMIDSFNSLVNLVHNGGWWFNKIADKSDMDFCSETPGLAAAASAHVYYDMAEKVGKIKKVGKKLKTLPSVKLPLLHTDEGVKWARLDRSTIDEDTMTAIVKVHTENVEKSEIVDITLSKQELTAIRKNHNARFYLRPKKGEGFVLPGGRVAVSI